ncbi:uncharacterized protein LOC119741498 isoform X2 [Patiria miniata]|uniref:Uncharacterized protein n=1 Tax=Patiria miniata TaxID=46514 RepID=A0A914BCN8_PATMI|nr:uncharacterized protein LOC119741498 isoform X2 [Patiria miniata]
MNSIQLKCYAHMYRDGMCEGDIRPASDKSWADFLRSVQVWKTVSAPGASYLFLPVWHREAARVARAFLDGYPLGVVVEEMPIPVNAGFHRQCYTSFTSYSLDRHDRSAVIDIATEMPPVTPAEQSQTQGYNNSLPNPTPMANDVGNYETLCTVRGSIMYTSIETGLISWKTGSLELATTPTGQVVCLVNFDNGPSKKIVVTNQIRGVVFNHNVPRCSIGLANGTTISWTAKVNGKITRVNPPADVARLADLLNDLREERKRGMASQDHSGSGSATKKSPLIKTESSQEETARSDASGGNSPPHPTTVANDVGNYKTLCTVQGSIKYTSIETGQASWKTGSLELATSPTGQVVCSVNFKIGPSKKCVVTNQIRGVIFNHNVPRCSIGLANGAHISWTTKVNGKITHVNPLADVARFADLLNDLHEERKRGNASQDHSGSASATERSPLLRFGSRLSQEGTARSSHLWSDTCVICQGTQNKRDNHSGLRRKEPLTVCEQIDGGALLTAARLKKDEDLLLHIENKDCVAIGLKYHRSCLMEYTSIPKNPEGSEPPVPLYDKAFKVFCADTIDRLLFQDKNVFRMTKLKRIFDRTVQEVEDQDSSGYRTSSLKDRLIKSYPQLCFLKPKTTNICELVYADSLTREDLIEDLTTLKESVRKEESDSDSSSGMQEANEQSSTPSWKSSRDHMWTCNRVGILRDRYSTALDIKRDIASIPSNHDPWPPTSLNLTVDDARRIVPTKLFNFLAWIVGSSDDPKEDEMVKVVDGDERKILAMALDVIYMATREKSAPTDASSAKAF